MDLALVYIMISVLGGAMGQILLKKGMSNMGPLTLGIRTLGNVLWKMGLNPFVVAGLGIYAAGTIFWLVALSRVELSFAYPFASLSYVVMLGAAWILFKEDLTVLRLAGTAVVCLGVLLVARS
jgi:drug/metabolite transporter (DMT)-like permease